MAKMRIIKRKDGVIQTQHRFDQRYDDSTLPRGTRPEDVADQAVVEASEIEGVEDTQAQLDVAAGQLVRDLTRKPLREQLVERRAAAEAVLAGLDSDSAVPAAVRKYLVALRDHLNLGPGRITHPQPLVSTSGRR